MGVFDRISRMIRSNISELLDKGQDTYETSIRVAGKVADGSIEWNAKELELKFAVVEGGASQQVI